MATDLRSSRPLAAVISAFYLFRLRQLEALLRNLDQAFGRFACAFGVFRAAVGWRRLA